jgi:hypothetical protein
MFCAITGSKFSLLAKLFVDVLGDDRILSAAGRGGFSNPSGFARASLNGGTTLDYSIFKVRFGLFLSRRRNRLARRRLRTVLDKVFPRTRRRVWSGLICHTRNDGGDSLKGSSYFGIIYFTPGFLGHLGEGLASWNGRIESRRRRGERHCPASRHLWGGLDYSLSIGPYSGRTIRTGVSYGILFPGLKLFALTLNTFGVPSIAVLVSYVWSNPR